MLGRRPLSHAALVVALCVVTGACFGGDDDSESARQVCPPEERSELIVEKLTREVPSSTFAVAPAEEAWASVVADADYSPSALFPGVATLYLIDAGTEPQLRDDANGLPIIGDPAIPYDAEGEWHPVTAVPGDYRLWSLRGPHIAVVACPVPSPPG